MSLVAYDSSSDESEDETKVVKKQKLVKIRIPSLKENFALFPSQFEDDEEEKPLAKKPKMQSGSGLFSLLPPPKNASTLSKPGFVPHILKSKKEQPSFTPTQSKNKSANKETTTTSLIVSEEQESDDENVCTKGKPYEENSNVPGNSDFFWLDDLASSSKVKEDDHNNLSVTAKNSCFIQNLSSQLPSPSYSDIQPSNLNETKEVSYMQQCHHLSESEEYDGLGHISEQGFSTEQQLNSLDSHCGVNGSMEDPAESLLKDKEFLKIQGRKKEFEGINIIDINADDHLPNKEEWLRKNLTEETTHRPKRKYNMPTSQQKRKHQITYLAFQAKEREMDLKNQWAMNSSTRRETQAKYGF